MGLSSKFCDKKSILYYFYQDGGYIPVETYIAVGTGEFFASYYLKRYWQKNITMREFAQLGDFIIRLVGNEKYNLAIDVGLDPGYPFPQIIYIPNEPEFCRKYNNGKPKSDCSPTRKELEEFKNYSEKKIKNLYDQPFF